MNIPHHVNSLTFIFGDNYWSEVTPGCWPKERLVHNPLIRIKTAKYEVYEPHRVHGRNTRDPTVSAI